MVTWGANTVHTFGNSSPAPSFQFGSTPANTPAAPFGSPAPTAGAAGGFAFGSPTPGAPGTGLFGSTTTAPAPLFGAPAAPTSLFGNPAPSPFGTPSSGSLFGQPPTAPPGGGLFGAPPAPSGGLFGAASPFGAPQQQQQQPLQQQLPAQAALQAHMDASARQEQARIQGALSKIHQNYIGTQPATEDKSSHFVSLLYNQATPEYQQLQWLHGMWVVGNSSGEGGGGQAQQQQQHSLRRPVAPPRPPQVAERDWEQAVVRNPDHTQCMPVALVGAEALQGRLGSQQERANEIVNQLKALGDCREAIAQRLERVQSEMVTVQQRQIRQRQKLLDLMQRVEVFRCYNNPLLGDEIKAMQRATELYQQADHLMHAMRSLEDLASKDKKALTSGTSVNGGDRREPERQLQLAIPNEEELKGVLTEHRDELATLVTTVKQDLRDLDLIQRRLEATAAPRVPVPTRLQY